MRSTGGSLWLAVSRGPRRCCGACPDRAPFARRRRARGALRVLRGAHVCASKPTSSPSGTRATIRPRRFCSASCAARGRAAWRACTPAAAALSGRCSTAGAATCGPISRSAESRSSTTSRTTMSSIPRNRVRAELLPLLERRFNPSIVDVLADEAMLAREEWDWIQQAAREAGPTVVSRPDPFVWLLDVPALERLPAAVARATVRGALMEAAAGRPVSFRHVEDAVQLLRRGGGPLDGPGLRLERRGASLVLTSRGGERARVGREANLFRYSLSIPGEVALREAGCVVSVEAAPSAGSAVLSNPAVAVVQLDRCQTPFAVRNRRPGDRFRPLGLDGRKKLQDYLRRSEGSARAPRPGAARRRPVRSDRVGGGARNRR